MFSIVSVAHAAGGNPVVSNLITKLSIEILNPLIKLVFAIAIVVFLWGLYELIRNAADPGAREKAQQHIMYGIVGMFIMVSAYGILNFVLTSVNDILR